MMRITWSMGWSVLAAVAGLALLLPLGPVAWGDEPPPDDQPPVVEKPDAAPAKPAADEPPPWSSPAAPPTPAAESPALPPPVVRVRKRGAAPVATPVATPERGSTIKDVPDEVPAPQPARAADPASELAPAPLPAPTPAEAAQAEGGDSKERLPIAMTPSLVQSITKTHNVPHGKGDERALKLDIEYEVVGEAGHDVYVGVWFLHRERERYVRSAMWQHGDPQGYLTVQTRPARVRCPTVRYLATLQVPYAAFPMRQGELEYEVEARVHILRRVSGMRMVVLARGETTFTVHADPAEPPVAAPPAETAPAPEAVPGETGTLEEPGVSEGEGPEASPSPTGVIEDVPER